MCWARFNSAETNEATINGITSCGKPGNESKNDPHLRIRSPPHLEWLLEAGSGERHKFARSLARSCARTAKQLFPRTPRSISCLALSKARRRKREHSLAGICWNCGFCGDPKSNNDSTDSLSRSCGCVCVWEAKICRLRSWKTKRRRRDRFWRHFFAHVCLPQA